MTDTKPISEFNGWGDAVTMSRKALLGKYLQSRGMNPEYTSKDVKDSYAKTNSFKIWMKNHIADSQKVESVDIGEEKAVFKIDDGGKETTISRKSTSPVERRKISRAGDEKRHEIDWRNDIVKRKLTPEGVERKRQLSKSARMIKAIYKHHGVKEEMEDWEKQDKSDKPYGKPPRVTTPNGKVQAAAVITGGTTLTGEKRDDIEIDPKLKARPGQTEFVMQGKKTQ